MLKNEPWLQTARHSGVRGTGEIKQRKQPPLVALFRKEAAYYRSAKICPQIQGPELKSATLFPGKLKTPIIYKLK